MDINYDKLTSINRAERDNFGLQELGENFIEEFSAYLDSKKQLLKEAEKEQDALSREVAQKSRVEIENAQKIFDEIFERREKKIINQALLSMKTDAKVVDTGKMLEHERNLFDSSMKIIKKSREFVSVYQSKSLKRPKTPKIHVLQDIPSFVWKNGEVIGPFKKEDVLDSLPEDVLEILVKERKCELK